MSKGVEVSLWELEVQNIVEGTMSNSYGSRESNPEVAMHADQLLRTSENVRDAVLERWEYLTSGILMRHIPCLRLQPEFSYSIINTELTAISCAHPNPVRFSSILLRNNMAAWEILSAGSSGSGAVRLLLRLFRLLKTKLVRLKTSSPERKGQPTALWRLYFANHVVCSGDDIFQLLVGITGHGTE
ncbi:hypothetical protein ACJ73_02432 [Blastomyces percursus]|uniref:Uncharacterized protein n=1 Tax=Blastomyces percursus TaxID=1658174 RepID=A0A1J9QDL4_9EURO|nr:hypothetical protein ACJ73_02432 [Blastomyces percursus]